MQLTISRDLSDGEANEIGDKLDAFNAEQCGIDDEKGLRLAARDADGKLIGGLTGVTGMQWLYIHILWIELEFRKQGVGLQLVKRAEELAKEAGCRAACLMTFSFQAKEFYEGFGYEEYGVLPDYPEGHSLHFMKKELG
ncbi:MAG: GNAT family N-acetyltransferase [Verrucomicrobiota bacterium]